MKVLFVCNQNENRSKTAEKIFQKKFETKSAGLFNDNPISEEDMSWADKVIVMEEFQRSELAERFPKQYMKKQILSLNIPDIYQFDQPELVNILNSKISEIL